MFQVFSLVAASATFLARYIIWPKVHPWNGFVPSDVNIKLLDMKLERELIQGEKCKEMKKKTVSGGKWQKKLPLLLVHPF